MHGPALRLIKSQGSEFTVRNASGGGARDSPSYSDDGTLIGVLERRSSPQVSKTSAGEDVETDLEIRAVPDSSTTLRGQGDDSGYPTKLVHPQGQTYEVVATFPEDSGVTVLSVVRD